MFSIKALLGDQNEKFLKEARKHVLAVNALEGAVSGLTDADLKAKTAEFRTKLAEGTTLDSLIPEAFAVVREAAKRTLGQRHFDVQLMGGLALHKGAIAEMRTGEGKTLVATLAVYANALAGKGVHVVTVNDYLSRRDAVWMGQVYAFLGLSVGILNHDASFLYDPLHKSAPAEAKEGDPLDRERDQTGSFKVVHEFLRPCSRKDAYQADVTYGTNSELGFDYLRDNLEYRTDAIRQRPFHYAVVDEIDSILIDEARTPLIISAPSRDSGELYATFAKIALKLNKEEDYGVDEKLKAITLTDSGIAKAEKILGVGNIYTEGGIKYVHHLETAVKAQALYKRDDEYVVKDGEIVIVDTFTGRLQPGRRWSEGLHQAIEAKEGVAIQKESRTYASITYQNFFRLYSKLGGMTGTAKTSSEEFYRVYGLDTFVMPTNKPVARIDRDDLVFRTEAGKFKAVARKVKELHAKGQPVLVGTVSIEKNEVLAQYLKAEGVPHVLLNAKNHEKEGEIIAQAGKPGAVTIATNMAGRGVDIKLGGNPAPEGAQDAIRALGGLFVLGTERHEARRIDNQLRGRSGRQGDVGETQFFVSLEDSLMRIFASDTVKSLMGKLGIAEDEAIENRMITRSLESAQSKIEGFNFDSRKHVLEYDDVLNLQRKSVYERRRAILLGDAAEVEKRLAQIVGDDAELAKAVEGKRTQLGGEFIAVMRQLMLQTIDTFWVEHLEIMDYSRSSVNLRAYGQRDPLVEYKKEGIRLFREMNEAIDAQVANVLPHVGGPIKEPAAVALKETQEGAQSLSKNNTEAPQAPKMKNTDGSDVGRNDPCPCGSGKKFKKCHGQE
jgi:preprotein translocase subunit SecA